MRRLSDGLVLLAEINNDDNGASILYLYHVLYYAILSFTIQIDEIVSKKVLFVLCFLGVHKGWTVILELEM
jgi:hypothetical protein